VHQQKGLLNSAPHRILVFMVYTFKCVCVCVVLCVQTDAKSLTILSAWYSDFGNISCTAESLVGRVLATGSLVVVGNDSLIEVGAFLTVANMLNPCRALVMKTQITNSFKSGSPELEKI